MKYCTRLLAEIENRKQNAAGFPKTILSNRKKKPLHFRKNVGNKLKVTSTLCVEYCRTGPELNRSRDGGL
jgi:hypothetical protein